MSVIADLIAASASLQVSRDLSHKEFDYQMHDHVATVRRLLSVKTLGSLALDETVLDVRTTLYPLLISFTDKD